MFLSVHPFPARMAPDLALKPLERLPKGTVLDPMSGSGTVARMAKQRGLNALAFDLDPLAVLISKVSTTVVDDDEIADWGVALLKHASSVDEANVTLPWLDGDTRGEQFVNYWFGANQIESLRRLSYSISVASELGIPEQVSNVFRVALSRIIVTKKQSGSLAQDTSHSRPHRVTLVSDYDIFAGFEKSLKALRKRLKDVPRQGTASISIGDSRNLESVDNESIDAVITSPPYLNALDYIRGHRLSLIWLGHRHNDLTQTRSRSIGSERMPEKCFTDFGLQKVREAIGDVTNLSTRHQGMVDRYIIDLHAMLSEVSRVLKAAGQATFVVGDSCLKGVYIQNSSAIQEIASIFDLGLVEKSERELPSGSRYLPTPSQGRLSKRMRSEVVMTFRKA